MRVKFTFLLMCFLTISSIAQSPIWPLATNPHNYNTAQPTKSEVVDWQSGSPINTIIPNGPLNTAHGSAMGGYDCCGNMLFYVIHSGKINNNELWVRNQFGDVILVDNSGSPLGLNGVRSDSEIQVVRVPNKCDEWYIIYLENSMTLGQHNNDYHPKKLLQAKIKFNPSNGKMNIVGNSLNIPINGNTYQHGKAISKNKLYTVRRANISNSLIIDEFNISSVGISLSKSSANINATWYSLTCPSSFLEISSNGSRLAFINYDQTIGRNNLLIFDIALTTISLSQTILLDKCKIKPHDNTIAMPSGYFNPTTTYTNSNPLYNNSSNWKYSGEFINATNTNLNLGHLQNFARKLSRIQFAPTNNNIIYITAGGFIAANLNNLTYIAQLDLNTHNSSTNSCLIAIKTQIANGLTSASIASDKNEGRGAGWSSAMDPLYFNDHSISHIQNAVDGKIYFTKKASNKLFVLPNPNALWLASDLYAKEIDLSIPGHQNINTTSDVLFLPDHDDYFDYSPTQINIQIQNPINELCQNSQAHQFIVSPSGGIWSGSNLISNNGSFNPTSIGTYTLSYSKDGCVKSIIVNVKACPPNCCNQVTLSNENTTCCSNIKTTCKVKSLSVNIIGGTAINITSSCGPTNQNFIGQSQFIYNPQNLCPIDFKVCASNLSSTIEYNITFEDGTTCKKTTNMNCKVSTNTYSPCCPPIVQTDIYPHFTPVFPSGSSGPYMMNFTLSQGLKDRMQAYINLLKQTCNAKQLIMNWQLCEVVPNTNNCTLLETKTVIFTANTAAPTMQPFFTTLLQQDKEYRISLIFKYDGTKCFEDSCDDKLQKPFEWDIDKAKGTLKIKGN